VGQLVPDQQRVTTTTATTAAAAGGTSAAQQDCCTAGQASGTGNHWSKRITSALRSPVLIPKSEVKETL